MGLAFSSLSLDLCVCAGSNTCVCVCVCVCLCALSMSVFIWHAVNVRKVGQSSMQLRKLVYVSFVCVCLCVCACVNVRAFACVYACLSARVPVKGCVFLFVADKFATRFTLSAPLPVRREAKDICENTPTSN